MEQSKSATFDFVLPFKGELVKKLLRITKNYHNKAGSQAASWFPHNMNRIILSNLINTNPTLTVLAFMKARNFRTRTRGVNTKRRFTLCSFYAMQRQNIKKIHRRKKVVMRLNQFKINSPSRAQQRT